MTRGKRGSRRDRRDSSTRPSHLIISNNNYDLLLIMNPATVPLTFMSAGCDRRTPRGFEGKQIAMESVTFRRAARIMGQGKYQAPDHSAIFKRGATRCAQNGKQSRSSMTANEQAFGRHPPRIKALIRLAVGPNNALIGLLNHFGRANQKSSARPERT
jgi:hypothetical protein